MKKIFFPNLDGLRFFAFFAVFLAHSFYSPQPEIASSKLYITFREVGHLGMFGVNFFFVLSGFLITYLLLDEKNVTKKINLKNFYIRRILRIWPLYYAVIIVGFIAIPLIQRHVFGQINYVENANLWHYLFFVNNFSPSDPDTAVLGVLWSIAVEEQFYVIWPILIFLIPTRLLPYTFNLIIISSIIFRLELIGYGYKHTLSCMSDLAVGSLFAYYAYYSSRFVSFFSNLKFWQILAIYIAGGMLFLLRSYWSEIAFLYLNERLIFSLFFAFIILEQNYSQSKYKVGRLHLFSELGKVTYGLYMLHFIAIYSVSKIFAVNFNGSLLTVLLVEPMTALILSIGLALLSYKFFERYFLGLKKHFSV